MTVKKIFAALAGISLALAVIGGGAVTQSVNWSGATHPAQASVNWSGYTNPDSVNWSSVQGATLASVNWSGYTNPDSVNWS